MKWNWIIATACHTKCWMHPAQPLSSLWLFKLVATGLLHLLCSYASCFYVGLYQDRLQCVFMVMKKQCGSLVFLFVFGLQWSSMAQYRVCLYIYIQTDFVYTPMKLWFCFFNEILNITRFVCIKLEKVEVVVVMVKIKYTNVCACVRKHTYCMLSAACSLCLSETADLVKYA